MRETERARGERWEKNERSRDRRWKEPGSRFKRNNGTTVYVNNLPEMLDKFGLRGIFQKAGRVVDSYIPKKKKEASRRRYGFVRFGTMQEAGKSIQMLNNKVIRESKLSVKLARSSKQRRWISNTMGRKMERPVKQSNDREWKKKKIVLNEREHNEEQYSDHQRKYRPEMQSIRGTVNEDFVPWLSKSLICTSPEPRDVATLASAIMQDYGQCTKICALSGVKFILTYQSEEEREAALQNHTELDVWFSEVQRWDKYTCCSSRRVWLEVIGVPPHGWVWENFKRIADRWGYLICLGKPILRTDSFDSMKILIETDILSFIENDCILHIEELGFRVHVREVSSMGVVIQDKTTVKANREEDVQSNGGIPGFEDLENSSDSMAQTANADQEVDNSRASMDQRANVDQEVHHNMIEGHIPRLPENREDSRNVTKQGEEPLMDDLADSINSTTRTKTACFSHNVCSDEVMMNSNPRVLGNDAERRPFKDVTAEEVEKAGQEPPGFEVESIGNQKICHTNMTLMHEHMDSHSNGHESGPIEPPGFEATGSIIGDRRTAQNSKKGLIKGDKGSRGNNCSKIFKSKNGTDSVDTCEKLAKEALHIGQMLGIKVVRHEKAAVARLAESMRKQKGKKIKPDHPNKN